MPLTPELAALGLSIEDVECHAGSLALESYGGERPTSTVWLRGAGAAGRGEHVGWTPEAHAAFRGAVASVPRGRWRLDEWVGAMARAFAHPYDRAALEAAAIDLGLRQAGTNLFRLLAVRPQPVRYVVSYGRVADPAAEARRHPGVELKIDADAGWSDDVYRALAVLGRVRVLDFKGHGDARALERARRALPDVLIEDPPPGTSPGGRVSFDASIRRAADVATLPFRPAAVNLKPARMGGVLEVLGCAALCADAGIGVYMGGMFEVGAGRAQLRTLAALLCPDATNDIAPLAGGARRAGGTPPAGGTLPAGGRPPARLPVDASEAVFGGEA